MLISIVNGKSGVGRTTIAAHLAGWLDDHDVRVAVIDADPHGGLARWLSSGAPHIPVKRYTTADQLHARARRVNEEYDVVVADGPAGRNLELATLAAISDLCLLPIRPVMTDVWAASHTARIVDHVRRHPKRLGLPHAFTVMNLVDPQQEVAAVSREATRRFRFPVAQPALHKHATVAETRGRGRFLWNLGPRADHAAREFTALFEAVLEISTGVEASTALARDRETRSET